MKKILIITTIGGFLPQFEMNDVKLLMEQGYEIHYATNFANPVYELNQKELEEMGIRLHPVDIQKSPLHIRQNIRALRELCAIIKTEEIRVLHCHNPMGGVLGRLAAMTMQTAVRPYVIYTAHGFHFYKGAPLLNWLLFYPAEFFLAGYTDCIVTINREDDARARSFMRRRWKRRIKAVYRIPGVGVCTSRFAPDEKVRRQVRKELKLDENIFYILSVGELNHNKNHEAVIRALARLRDPDVFYGICGKGYRREYLEGLARKLGVARQVRFFGFRNDIPRMLQGADCFVFPSKREGLGIAALEAMAAGIPMITSDCRGTREYMEDGITGYVCHSNSPEEYGELIRQMKEEPDRRREMSIFCRRRAREFDLERTDGIMRQVYGEMK